MSFHSDSKANLAHADCNSDPSRNVNFDEAQANTTNISKKRTFVGLMRYLTIYFFKSKTNDQNAKPTLKNPFAYVTNATHLLRSFKTQTL